MMGPSTTCATYVVLLAVLVMLSACEMPPAQNSYDERNTDAYSGINRITNTPFDQDRRDYFKDRGP